MYKAPLLLLLIAGLTLSSSDSALAIHPYEPEAAKKVRQKAISLFIAHKYKKSNKCFDDYCLHFPGDTEHLKIELDGAFNEIKNRVNEDPDKLLKLRNSLDTLYALSCQIELRARFPSTTKTAH